jgi:hypothetical protein
MKWIEEEWLRHFKGKTLLSVRPTYSEGSRIPSVTVTFTDASVFLISPREGIYFEGCLINVLRKARPIEKIECEVDPDDCYLEVRADTFPLFILLGQNKRMDDNRFPFNLEELEPATLEKWRKAIDLKRGDWIIYEGNAIRVKYTYVRNTGVEIIAYDKRNRMVTPTFGPETLVEIGNV